MLYASCSLGDFVCPWFVRQQAPWKRCSPVSMLELNVPQALIYGWLLQLSYAFLPYLFRRVFLPGQQARLGGNWFSLVAVGVGTILQWASIFAGDYLRPMQGIAYVLWVLSVLPILAELWGIVRSGLEQGGAKPIPNQEFGEPNA